MKLKNDVEAVYGKEVWTGEYVSEDPMQVLSHYCEFNTFWQSISVLVFLKETNKAVDILFVKSVNLCCTWIWYHSLYWDGSTN